MQQLRQEPSPKAGRGSTTIRTRPKAERRKTEVTTEAAPTTEARHLTVARQATAHHHTTVLPAIQEDRPADSAAAAAVAADAEDK